MILRTPRHTLFPSTTLFRSAASPTWGAASHGLRPRGQRDHHLAAELPGARVLERRRHVLQRHDAVERDAQRSEEHTSELQSRQYIVCRLLLEKKKTQILLKP